MKRDDLYSLDLLDVALVIITKGLWIIWIYWVREKIQ